MSVVYWSLYSIYFRTLTYFAVANPKIYLGGMLDERKTDIYQLVPSEYLPKMKMYTSEMRGVKEDIEANFTLPVIVKPNVGFRGFMVKRIDTLAELAKIEEEYLNKELLVQEFISFNHEYSVMYYFIDHDNYGVSSLVEKHLPKITGDGERTIGEILSSLENPFLNKNWVKEKYAAQLNDILERGKVFTLDHVGNYARGSKFENLEQHIDTTLVETIKSFYQKVQGMNFCRMDVKAKSLEDLKKGNFILLEINGAKSEPLHIYDPQMTILQIIKVIHRHWSTLFSIVKKNIKIVDFPSSREGIRSYYSLKKMVS